GGEVWIYNVHIRAYSNRGYSDHEPTRKRKLLLHRTEIRKLTGKTVEKGRTLVPVRMYLKNGRVKIAISLAKGKKAHDKRETIKRRETERETRAAVNARRQTRRLYEDEPSGPDRRRDRAGGSGRLLAVPPRQRRARGPAGRGRARRKKRKT